MLHFRFETAEFLPKLNAMAPGLQLELPTEAQWEYACRAGTTTPFSFGEQITTNQVNYNGNFPYAGGEKIEYREKTVQVKALPANPWGLYQMHGNVWEWCADEYSGYPGPVDPFVQQEIRERGSSALRGGGWLDYGKSCRAAFRGVLSFSSTTHHIGFRLIRLAY